MHKKQMIWIYAAIAIIVIAAVISIVSNKPLTPEAVSDSTTAAQRQESAQEDTKQEGSSKSTNTQTPVTLDTENDGAQEGKTLQEGKALQERITSQEGKTIQGSSDGKTPALKAEDLPMDDQPSEKIEDSNDKGESESANAHAVINAQSSDNELPDVPFE